MHYQDDTVAWEIFSEYRENLTLSTVQYIDDMLPLFKDEILYNFLKPTDDWLSYRHISEMVLPRWNEVEVVDNPPVEDSLFQFGVGAVSAAFDRESRKESGWLSYRHKYDFEDETFERFIDYKGDIPNENRYSAYLTSTNEYSSFADGVLSEYGKRNLPFRDLLNNSVALKEPTDEFRQSLYGLPIYIGKLEPNSLCHAEMVSTAIYMSMYPDTLFYFLPEYEDVDSIRWVSAKLKKFSTDNFTNVEVLFGDASTRSIRNSLD